MTVSEWEIMEAVCALLQPMGEAIAFTELCLVTRNLKLCLKLYSSASRNDCIPLIKLMISDMESTTEYLVAARAIANKLKVELQKYEAVFGHSDRIGHAL